MSSRALTAAFALLLAVFAACGDATGPVSEDLVGSWEAVPACLPRCGFTLVSVANSADTLNLTRQLGAAVTATITEGGRFSLRFQLGRDSTVTGDARTEGSQLIVTGSGTTDTLDYAVGEGHLTLNFRELLTVVDFDADGKRDPARARATLRRKP